MTVVVDEQLDLLYLQRALMEARFASDPVDRVLLGSPRLAEIHRYLVDELIELDERRPGVRAPSDWREWRRFSTRTREREVIVERLKTEDISGMDEQSRLAYLRVVTAPFEATDAELNLLSSDILS